jgi:hypothetical protein
LFKHPVLRNTALETQSPLPVAPPNSALDCLHITQNPQPPHFAAKPFLSLSLTLPLHQASIAPALSGPRTLQRFPHPHGPIHRNHNLATLINLVIRGAAA